MKTISLLQDKLWYRAIKILYILIFILLIGTFIIYHDIKDDILLNQDIEQSKDNLFQKDRFYSDVVKLMNHNKIDKRRAYDETLKYYKSKGYTIEGIDINEELLQIQPEIDQIYSNKKTEAELKSNINTFMKDNGVDFQTAFSETLKIYKERGYTIDGVNIDEELGLVESTQEIQKVKNIQSKGFLDILPYYKLIFLWLFVYIIFFQIINRLFYYIILGKYFPES